MELIYSMRRKPLKCEPPQFERSSDPEIARPLCTISVSNIIAFSSPTDLSDTDGDTWSGHVYVCDLDTPWDSHKVTSTTHAVSALEWDCEGKCLLVGTTEGDVSVYAQKDFLLNDWTCLYSTSFPGEQIVRGTFFHNGRRVSLIDKKGDCPIAERVTLQRPAPSLKGFGGTPLFGVLIITATGLLGAVTPSEGSSPHVTTEILRAKRDRVMHASFTHKAGSILVAALTRWSGRWSCRVACIRLQTLRKESRPSMQLKPLPSLHLADTLPGCISWWTRDDSEWLVVGGPGGPAGGSLALWKLTERSHPVHKLFNKGPVQGSTTPGGGQKPGSDCFNTLAWQQVAAWPVEGPNCVVACPTGVTSLAVVAAGRKVHLLSRDSHHYLSSRSLPSPDPTGNGPDPAKKAKYDANASVHRPMVSGLSVSTLGGVVVCVDARSQLHVLRLPFAADKPMTGPVWSPLAALELAMVTGGDCLDVLLALKPGQAEPVLDRLTEVFQRQPPSFQQYYLHSWLKIRVALCRLLPTGHSSVSALTCLQMLHGTWAAVAAAARPDDKPESTMYAALTDDNASHADAEKALAALEAKSEVNEGAPVGSALLGTSLIALRRPLRRAIDIACSLLASLPHSVHQHGYSLASDTSAITILRKLVALARWGSGGGGGRLDSSLMRLLQRLSGTQPRQDLLEECLALNAQMAWSRVWESLPRCSVSAPHGKPYPLVLSYGVEPSTLRIAPEPPHALADAPKPPPMDSTRYMYMGGSRLSRWRQCGRCGAQALPVANKLPLRASNDHRWRKRCRCGGKWTLVSSV